MTADPKPVGRVRDPSLLKALHLEWQECALCHGTEYSEGGLSLHHIKKHPRDDLRGNLVMLCGHGTTGCHGLVEKNQMTALALLGAHIVAERPDTIEYLDWRLGGLEATREWLQRVLWVRSFPMTLQAQQGAP